MSTKTQKFSWLASFLYNLCQSSRLEIANLLGTIGSVIGTNTLLSVTNFYLVTYGQFWASGQYKHNEINPQGPQHGVFNSTLIKYNEIKLIQLNTIKKCAK